jgi:hypothetical protein
MPNKNFTNQKIQQVVALLKESHERWLNRRKIASAALFVSVLLAGISILIVLEGSVYFSGLVKSISLGVLMSAAVLSAYFLLVKIREFDFRTFYEQFFTAVNRKNVLSAVDLYLDEEQKKSRFYEAAISANLKTVEISTLKKELNNYIKNTRASKALVFSSGVMSFAVLLCIFTVWSMPAETTRTLHFWTGYDQPNPFTYVITPADTTIEHGSAIQVGILFEEGARPDNVILKYKTDVEESYRQRQMQLSETGTFISPEIDLINNITYRVEMDGFLSSDHRVSVQLQPRFDQLTATVIPPSYTGLSRSEQEYPFSQVNMYPGSILTIEGTTNKPVQSIQINKAGETIEMGAANEERTQFSAEFQPVESDTIHFEMVDEDGLNNRNPFRTFVNLREDQYPTVVIQEPTGTVMKSDPENVDIFYQATDDFGLTRAELHWEHQRAFVEQAATGSKALDSPGNGRMEQVRWDLDDFELRPRDQLRFTIRVWDNDEVAGYKMSESNQVVIQVPSLAEYFDELDSRERDTQSELDRISDDFDNMEGEYQEFLERMRQNPEGGFEEERMLEEIRDRQQSIDDAVKDLNEKFEQMRSEIEGSDRVSEETQRAYRELQELMNELDDPDLREAMEELQRALESLSPQDLERALENVSFNEQLYRERIERTVELFKRLKMNSDLDKLARQYEDMSERLQQQEEGTTTQQLSRELENVQQDLDKVSEQLEQLDSNPPRRSEERLRELKEEGQRGLESIRDQLEQLMEDARQNGEGDEGEGGQSPPTEEMEQQQEQISQQMQQESERFRNSVQQMSGQQLQVNIAALQRALYTLLELSDMQEYLTQSSTETRNRSQGFVDLARLQNNVSDQFSAVADTLFQVSSELPGVPNQINRKKLEVEQRIGRSIDEMVERNQRGATITTRESLGGINDLTSMLASLIDQLMDQQNGGMGSGMSMQQMVEQLQNMSGDQQQLNQQLQDLINDVQGDRLTREQSERLDQIARQQNEIRRQLQELQQSGALEQGDRTLSELQRMLEEMEDSINDMRGGITDPLMVERQQNILSRMLNAEESLQQRGEEEEREGTAAMEYDRILPPDITLEELQQEIRARMQDPNYTRFSEQYQRLIERYFEQLRRLEGELVP